MFSKCFQSVSSFRDLRVLIGLLACDHRSPSSVTFFFSTHPHLCSHCTCYKQVVSQICLSISLVSLSYASDDERCPSKLLHFVALNLSLFKFYHFQTFSTIFHMFSFFAFFNRTTHQVQVGSPIEVKSSRFASNRVLSVEF